MFTDSIGQVLVMDYAPYGSMSAYVMARGRLPEKLARWFYQQLIVALDFCHKQVSAPPLPHGTPGLLRPLSYPSKGMFEILSCVSYVCPRLIMLLLSTALSVGCGHSRPVARQDVVHK